MDIPIARGAKADLTNVASRLYANHCGTFIAIWSQIVNGLFAFLGQTEQGSWSLDPVPPPLAWRGKFICRQLPAKWLVKMRFLDGPGHHAIDAALL
jgi:hypothetical protein